jgi:hypothetical protein
VDSASKSFPFRPAGRNGWRIGQSANGSERELTSPSLHPPGPCPAEADFGHDADLRLHDGSMVNASVYSSADSETTPTQDRRLSRSFPAPMLRCVHSTGVRPHPVHSVPITLPTYTGHQLTSSFSPNPGHSLSTSPRVKSPSHPMPSFPNPQTESCISAHKPSARPSERKIAAS